MKHTRLHKARLTRLATDNAKHGMRTDVMEGLSEEPEVGEPYWLWNDEPLDGEFDVRYLATSPVTAFDFTTGEFTTASGTQYRYERIDAE